MARLYAQVSDKTFDNFDNNCSQKYNLAAIMLNPIRYREQFPVFRHHPNLVYFDHAATSQKPQAVIDAVTHFYTAQNANIHRGIYKLGVEATQIFENTRIHCARWLNASREQEIIFTGGATASINLVAHSFLLPQLQAGDNVVISAMEHHANLIPWQRACQQKGAELRVIPVQADGSLPLEAIPALLDERTRLVALVHLSNTLGTINPVEKIIQLARTKGIPTLIDGCQSAAHYPIDVQAMDCDFFVCSGHKLFGPTGIGILYGKQAHLEQMPPFLVGGDMIREVSFHSTTFAPPPSRFEAGTPHIAGVAGLKAAIDFIQSFDSAEVKTHLQSLRAYSVSQLNTLSGIRIIGTAPDCSGIVSFTMDGIHPHDIASFLAQEGIAVRAGHHCTQPLMDRYQIPATIRASYTIFNTTEEIDHLVATLRDIQGFFA